MKMTLRTYTRSNEKPKILEFETGEFTDAATVLARLQAMLRAAQVIWPDELAGYDVAQKRSHKKRT